MILRTILLFTVLVFSCGERSDYTVIQESEFKESASISNKVKVLNFATFHMGQTNDAHTVEFDENNRKNIEEAHQIAQMLAQFKPTIILVETVPRYNETLHENYSKYLLDTSITFEHPDEVEILAFEVGRLSGTKRIYGIDHKMSYNYMIPNEIINSIDSTTINDYYANPFKSTPELNVNEDKLSLLEKLKLNNSQEYLDFLITVNADMLAFAGTDTGFEGADEAAKYYQRNLRIYSNINRIAATNKDRVFILSGGSHTAFLNEFMKRSPKYEVVNTFDYLK